jgi:hypothetical protein
MFNRDTGLHTVQQGSIKIIDVPPGKAPEEIRRKWVGLVLPIAPPEKNKSFMQVLLTKPNCYLGIFVESREEDFLTNGAYFVSGPDAIAILSISSGSTAKWWCEKAPYFLKPQSGFIFSAACCVVVDDDNDGVWPPPPKRAPSLG